MSAVSLPPALSAAVRQGLVAARQNFPVMAVLLAAMSAFVAAYYWWPAGAAFLSWYADWQQSGGLFRTALVAGFAGGILSELSVVYARDGGRWTLNHFENMLYRFLLFFVSGTIVYKFYQYQAVWFGDAPTWQVILPKVLVDQFIFSVFWSTPYQSLTFRWQVLRYSGSRLWCELDASFVTGRMLPILIANWMFWIPGVTLIYAMPLILQMPLNLFATAIWSVLLASLAKSTDTTEPVAEPLVP